MRYRELASSRRAVVLHVLPQDLNRGAQVYAGRLRDALRDDPDQKHLVVTLFKGPPGGATPDIALHVRSGPWRRIIDPRALWRLWQLARRSRASVLVAHGGEALKYVALAAGHRSSVYYKVGLSSVEIQRVSHRLFYGWLSRLSSRVVGNSTAILRQVEALFGIPMESMVLIPNARDPQVYKPLATLDKSADPPLVLFVGQLESGKRPTLFLDCIESLRTQGLSFNAAIVGDGPLRANLERRARELEVQLLGTRTDVPELLRRSAVVLMTSAPNTEGMPGVLIEAGMSGIPSVSTAAAGVSDVIHDGLTGYIVTDERAEILAARVAELLGNSELREAQGSSARERCLELFSISATARKWRELIAGLTEPEVIQGAALRTDGAE